jgi:CPA2 family monovalent cation:H+ antiporter-2
VEWPRYAEPVLAAAGGGPPPFLAEVVALLVAAAVIGYLFMRVRIVPIVGFLLAGVAIGPHALGLVDNQEAIDAAAEIGVILLLFTIGIEFSMARLAAMWRLVVLGGGLQVILTIGLTAAVLALFDVAWPVGVFTGFLVSLSSTAIVLRLLAARGQAWSDTGRGALAYLIFQDLAIVVMVLLVPMLGGDGGSALGIAGALGKAVAIIALVLVVARWVMPRLLEVVARACSPEVFLLTVIAICLGTAYLTSLAGVSVSLGAFLAGMVVSESRHSEHALGEILPLQILFSATFFVSVGLLLDVNFLVRNLPLVLAVIAGVAIIKILATAASAAVLRVRPGVVVGLSLLLVQVGEFSFVLERAGQDAGLSPAGLGEDGSQAFIAATVLLMVATPWLATAGDRLGAVAQARSVARRWAGRDAAAGPAGAGLAGAGPAAGGDEGGHRGNGALRDHIVISGYGPATRTLANDLTAAGVPFLITTLNPDGAAEAEDAGYPVLRGDSTRRHILELAGVPRARMVVIPEDGPEEARRIASVVRSLAPTVTIVVRVDDPVDLDVMVAAGADKLVEAHRSSRTALAKAVLSEITGHGFPPGRTYVDMNQIVAFRPDPAASCPHVDVIVPVLPGSYGCEECLRDGTTWVHLRVCLGCGHVGCCDSSPERHATRHNEGTGHPIIASMEPNDAWAWCYLDDTLMRPGQPHGADRRR